MQSTITQELVIHHSSRMSFEGYLANYEVLGAINMDMSSLKVTLVIQLFDAPQKHRIKLDLYNIEQVQNYCLDIAEKEGMEYQNLERDLFKLTDLLESHRNRMFDDIHGLEEILPKTLAINKQEEAIKYLEDDNLLTNLNELLEQTGIVGEENNRLLLLLVAMSYKFSEPLHAIIMSNSGSGKSHLINSIAACIPSEDVISLSRISQKSLYHQKTGTLQNKLVLLQDMDGLNDEALYCLRELQSHGSITSSSTAKDSTGHLSAYFKTVIAHFSSMGASTKELYYDNVSRSIIIKVDESEEQTYKIIAFQNKLLTGELSIKAMDQAKQLITNCIRVLKPYKVLNKYADKICLPPNVKHLRRLNKQFQSFVKLVTNLHQHQRKTDAQNRLITTKKDVKLSIELFFDSIWLKIDDLQASERHFFEELKTYLTSRKTEERTKKSFTQKEVRQVLNISKSHLARYIQSLVNLEYLKISSGSANKGYKYKISYWDDHKNDRNKVKQLLLNQLKSLK